MFVKVFRLKRVKIFFCLSKKLHLLIKQACNLSKLKKSAEVKNANNTKNNRLNFIYV